MRSNQEIIDQTNEVARIILASRGYITEQGTAFHTEEAQKDIRMASSWQAACKISELLTETDPQEAVDELEDDLDQVVVK